MLTTWTFSDAAFQRQGLSSFLYRFLFLKDAKITKNIGNSETLKTRQLKIRNACLWQVHISEEAECREFTTAGTM